MAGSKPHSTGVSRRALFLLDKHGPQTPTEMAARLKKLHPSLNRGSVQTILDRHRGLGLVDRDETKRYFLTEGGDRRVEFLRQHGKSFESPEGKIT